MSSCALFVHKLFTFRFMSAEWIKPETLWWVFLYNWGSSGTNISVRWWWCDLQKVTLTFGLCSLKVMYLLQSHTKLKTLRFKNNWSVVLTNRVFVLLRKFRKLRFFICNDWEFSAWNGNTLYSEEIKPREAMMDWPANRTKKLCPVKSRHKFWSVWFICFNLPAGRFFRWPAV